MVVADDRYLAEDACDRIRVEYDVLPPVVGIAAARRGARLVHEDVPDNIAATWCRRSATRRRRSPRHRDVLELDLEVERSASTPLEGKGVYARWDPDDGQPAGVHLHPGLDHRSGPRSPPSSGCRPTGSR